MKGIVLRASAVALASGLQVAMLAVLNLWVARLISVEDFGVVRTVTAYMTAFALVGAFCVHDAAAAAMVRANDLAARRRVALAATAVASVSSLLVCAAIEATLFLTPFWRGELRLAMSLIVLALPIAAMTQVYTSVLQAVGAYRLLAACLVLSGAIPLIVIALGTAWGGLQGWIIGRLIAYVLLLAVVAFLIRELLTAWRGTRDLIEQAAAIVRHARVQIISALLSMFLLSADVIMLERLTGDLRLVAVYGMAALFARSAAVLPGALGRVFFRDIAQQRESEGAAATRLLLLSALVSGALAILMALIVPHAIRAIYGDAYAQAVPVLHVMLLGLVFQSGWQAMSTINTARRRPDHSVVISLAGVITALLALTLFIRFGGAIGAAWAMNLTYLVCTLVGIALHVRARETGKLGVRARTTCDEI